MFGKYGPPLVKKLIDLHASKIRLNFVCSTRCDDQAFREYEFRTLDTVPMSIAEPCPICKSGHMIFDEQSYFKPPVHNGKVIVAMVVFTCSELCGEGGGRDFTYDVSAVIPAVLDETCPSCEKGVLVLDVAQSGTVYGTQLKDCHH